MQTWILPDISETQRVEASRKGPFIATQLKSTRRRVELCRYKQALKVLQSGKNNCTVQSKYCSKHLWKLFTFFATVLVKLIVSK